MRRAVVAFTKAEIRDLLKAWILLSLAFAIVFNGGFSLGTSFLVLILVASLTAGLGFVAHELSHKIVAIRMGCVAAFRANNGMLLLALLMSFFGFVFAAPGAVVIGGIVSPKRLGLISLAGPLANIVVALLFLPLVWVVPIVGHLGFAINAWLALFNMLPIRGMDGSKVLPWNKPLYFVVLGVSAILSLFAYVL